MRLILLITLVVGSQSSLLDGPFGDGKFLAHPTLSMLDPCSTGYFNALELSSDGTQVLNHDGAQYVTRCKLCGDLFGKPKFLNDPTGTKAGYADIISTLTGTHSVFNREECCYNSEHRACIEQIREYKRGCQSTGAYVLSTNQAGHGPQSSCTNIALWSVNLPSVPSNTDSLKVRVMIDNVEQTSGIVAGFNPSGEITSVQSAPTIVPAGIATIGGWYIFDLALKGDPGETHTIHFSSDGVEDITLTPTYTFVENGGAYVTFSNV